MTDEAPILNVMIEDYLARAATEGERGMMLQAWLLLGAEYQARQLGRGRTVKALEDIADIIRAAEPQTPWEP